MVAVDGLLLFMSSSMYGYSWELLYLTASRY